MKRLKAWWKRYKFQQWAAANGHKCGVPPRPRR